MRQVFLQHLSPLLTLPTFTALWLTILEFMDKYMHADRSDLLVRNILSTILVQFICCVSLSVCLEGCFQGLPEPTRPTVPRPLLSLYGIIYVTWYTSGLPEAVGRYWKTLLRCRKMTYDISHFKVKIIRHSSQRAVWGGGIMGRVAVGKMSIP